MPAYFIVDNEVTDPTGFEEYRKQVPGTVERYGGRFLVRGGQVQTLEGDWKPKRVVVTEFPSIGQMFWHVWVDLASAYAWRGQTAEAAAAVAEILKLRPGLTVQQIVEDARASSDNSTFRKEYERIAEGVRKAGLPER